MIKRAIAVFALILALPVAAQEDRKEELAAEILRRIDVKAMILNTLSPWEPDEKKRELRDRLVQQLSEARLIEIYTPHFVRLFTEPELKQTLEFYTTSAGQKSVRLIAMMTSYEATDYLMHTDEAREIEDEMEREITDPALITMNLLRSIATATEAYATDNNEYPQTDIHGLQPLLSPVYILTMPVLDGWGNGLFYVSDGQRYRFVSAGADGKFEWHSRALSRDGILKIEADSPEMDLIFENGDFLQRPRQQEQ